MPRNWELEGSDKMRQCPKCSQQYDDLARICRTCGAILDTVAEETQTSETAPEADEPPPIPGKPSWQCPQCRQSVPSAFDVCWNCGTSQDGTPDPDFVKVPQDGLEDEAEPALTNIPSANFQCPRCGSSKIIPQAKVLDQGQASDGYLKVVVYGDPEALIFKDRLFGRLKADVCGDCGHVELRVDNHEELYEHYLQATK